MFEQLIESSSRKTTSRRRWLYFGATAAVWVPGMLATVLAGVLAFDGRLSDQYAQPERVVLLYQSISHCGPASPNTPDRKPPSEGALTSPKETPREIPEPSILPPADPNVGGGGSEPASGTGPGGDPKGDLNGALNGVPGAPPGGTAPPPEPTPAPAPRKEEPTSTPTTKPRVSVVLQGTAVRRVEPAYPKIAREIHSSGPVVVEVVVDETGKVISARALSGPSLLRKAAEDAARGWKWNPTRLNEVPVQVIGTITFNFVL
jgi:protein TonB